MLCPKNETYLAPISQSVKCSGQLEVGVDVGMWVNKLKTKVNHKWKSELAKKLFFKTFMCLFTQHLVQSTFSKLLLKVITVKPPNNGHPTQRTCHEQQAKHLVPNVRIFLKLPSNSGHLLITNKYFKTGRCLLSRGFTVHFYFIFVFHSYAS